MAGFVWAVLSLWVLLPDSWILSRMDLMEIGSEDWGTGVETGVESCPLRALALVVLKLQFLLQREFVTETGHRVSCSNVTFMSVPVAVWSNAVQMHGSWVRILLRVWCLSHVFVVCCVSNGLWNELITHSEESYWLCVCLIVCDLETSTLSGIGWSWAVVPQRKKIVLLGANDVDTTQRNTA
jgi:hypothetical protein